VKNFNALKPVAKYLNVKVTFFWNTTSYGLVICYRRFRWACCVFRHQFSSPAPLTIVI